MSGWDLIAAELAMGRSVALKHGRFLLATLPGYVGRNPSTDHTTVVSEKRLPFFIPSDDFLRRTLGARSRFTSVEYEDLEFDVAPLVSLPVVTEFEELIFALLVEQPVHIENFGRFSVRDMRAVSDVGDEPLKQVIAFQPARELRQLINS